jgi:hypothetical protein
MRIPDAGPFGDTRFDASDRAMVAASFVNRPSGGWVESVLTFATHRRRVPEAFIFLFGGTANSSMTGRSSTDPYDSSGRKSSMMLEVLHGSLLRFRRASRFEGAEIAALPGFCRFLP